MRVSHLSCDFVLQNFSSSVFFVFSLGLCFSDQPLQRLVRSVLERKPEATEVPTNCWITESIIAG